jgi:hypothetical protein
MNVKGIEGDFSPLNPVRGKKNGESSAASSSGNVKVQVSGKARALFEAGQSARLDEIRSRLESGFYDAPEVTDKIVDGVMQDLLAGK